MTIDTESPAGSWRREILNGPATATQLREVISDLEHCLKISRRDYASDAREANMDLVKRLAEAVAREMEQRGQVAKLERELQAWNSRRTG
jgi:hypothetical protein